MATLIDRLSRLEAAVRPRSKFPTVPREHVVLLGVASEHGYFANLEQVAEVREMFQQDEELSTEQCARVADLLRELIANHEPLGTGWSPGNDPAARAKYARDDLLHALGSGWAEKESAHATP